MLTRAGVRRLRGGHPWIYADHVEHVEARDGQVVRLEGPVDTPRGCAVYGARSRLALRVVSLDPHLDPGGPWWEQRLDRAVQRRQEELASGEEACRWVHAEADGLPGLVVDRYAEVATLQAGCRWADELATRVAERLIERHGLAGVLARHDGAFRRPEGLVEEVRVLAGEVPRLVGWRRAGLEWVTDPWGGQKTGTYLDQRENQARAAARLPVGRLLDAFCHEGGFALPLAAAGSRVLALNGSASALARADENARANGLAERVETRRVNVFDALRDLVAAGEVFDGAVLDPPALAKRRAELPAALRAYKELNLRTLRLLRPGGRLLTCSCSSHLSSQAFLDVLREAAADARRDVEVESVHGAARCHPHRLTFPESAYLKAVFLRTP